MLSVLGVTPFGELAPWAVLCVALAHFAGFLIRGAFGFGSNLPIILATTWLLGPHHAIVLVVLTATMAQAQLFPQGVRRADWRLVAGLVVGVYVGIGVGTYVFVKLPADVLAPLLGFLVIGIVCMDRFRLFERLGRIVNLRARPTVGALATASGFVGTVSGGGGIYFLAPFLKHMCPDPVVFRSTSLVFSGIFMAGRAAFLALAGFIDLTTLIEAVCLLPAAFLGGWAGRRWFDRADAARFFGALSLMLLFGAALLVLKAL